MEKSISVTGNDVAARIAAATVAGREASYSDEVRRLLDAGRDAMRERGTGSKPRVADIVAAAGLSNDAFYRHFASKDRLVAAILEDGTERLRSYLAHQMSKAATPQDAVARWVDGVLAQAADPDIAATTLAVLWNGGGAAIDTATRPSASAPLGTLLHEPFAELGSSDPELDASLVAHAVVGLLSDLLWAGERPTPAVKRRIVAFCLGAVTPSA
ncbi:TetR/AcrR family transcriptional regulator [Aquihabitans sp. McL0605]|uniref:TetR/AcrR family transcriptional regulator n=1 Tax=Aquihabitans sp. McL0605 TaxID=3415671 RepID=UPI003CFB80AB